MDENKGPVTVGSLSEAERDEIREMIVARGAGTPCGRCGTAFDQFGLVPELAPINLFLLHEAISGIQEQNIPTAVFVCTNCGAVYQHAVGALGLLRLSQPRGTE